MAHLRRASCRRPSTGSSYAAVTAVRNELYVDAARVVGPQRRPHHRAAHPLVVRAPIIIQAAIDRRHRHRGPVGARVPRPRRPRVPTWGGMLNDGFANIYQAPLLLLWPSLAIGLTCIALVLLGNAHARRARAQRRGAASADEPSPPRRGSIAAVTTVGAVTGSRLRRSATPTARSGSATTSAPLLAVERARARRTDLRVGYGEDRPRSSTASRSTSAAARCSASSASPARARPRPRSRCSACSPRAAASPPAASSSRACDLGDAVERDFAAAPRHGASRTSRRSRCRTSTRRSRSAASSSSRCASHSGISRKEATEKRARAARPRRHPRPQAHLRRLPARDLRRHGAARAHRRRGLVRARPAHRRRADDGARRHRAGRGARPAARPAGGARTWRCCSSPTTSASSPTSATGSSVMQDGPHRRDRTPSARSSTTPQHPYTQSLLDAILEEAAPARIRPLDASRPSDGAQPMTDPLLDVDGSRRRVPRQGLPQASRSGRSRGSRSTSSPARPSDWSASPARARPRSAGPCSAWRRSPAGSVRFAARTSRTLRRERAARAVPRHPGRLPGPVLFAQPVADDRADPRRAAHGRGTSSTRSATRASRELLDQVGLPADARDRLPREFSGGQRQRIAIARALALDPQLIVCDEPVSALDLSTQARVLDLFMEIQERTGVAYLFVSHDLAVVRHISHRVAVMYRGEIVEYGATATRSRATRAPVHPAAAAGRPGARPGPQAGPGAIERRHRIDEQHRRRGRRRRPARALA